MALIDLPWYVVGLPFKTLSDKPNLWVVITNGLMRVGLGPGPGTEGIRASTLGPGVIVHDFGHRPEEIRYYIKDYLLTRQGMDG